MFTALLVTAIIVVVIAVFAVINGIEGDASPQPERKKVPITDAAPEFDGLIDAVEFWLD